MNMMLAEMIASTMLVHEVRNGILSAIAAGDADAAYFLVRSLCFMLDNR